MKKKSLRNLKWNKSIISNLEVKHIVGGGASGGVIGCNTRDNGCNTTVTITGGDPYKECE
ncbi:hypothetical protein U6A24_03365 [Aquimarina gracilis]|uniref:Bacteriocin-like protein n=1 Tax=Aquimarina gracilis TaxID=874422 RepID=A0ABU5ZSX8_9FLAO|nr:hypothetical protein [Aquimarina gracilis]MEB3344482.1 hypothetical protein [Aquimarina gracilis]